MTRRSVLLLGLLLAFTVAPAAGADTNTTYRYAETVTVPLGDTMSLGDYRLRYRDPAYTDSLNYFELGTENVEYFHILYQLNQNELFGAESKTVDFPNHNLSMQIRDVGLKDNSWRVKVRIQSDADIFSGVQLESTVPRKVIVSRGKTVTVPLTVKNTGITNQSFDLRASTNSSLTPSFMYDGFTVDSVYVGASNDKSVSAEIAVPDDAALGTHELQFVAANRSNATETVRLQVKGSKKDRGFRMDVEQTYAELLPGKETSVSINVRNTGEAAVNDIQFNVSGPDGWQTAVRPQEIDMLERHDRRGTRIMVQAPADAQPGDYFLDVTASAARATVEEPSRVRVHIREESGLEVAGVGLMLLSLLGLGAVYRKFGRR